MLKKLSFLVLVTMITLSMSLTGCVSQGEYDTLQKDYETSQSNLTSAQREYELLESQLATLKKEWEESKASLEAEIASQSATISDAQNTNTTLLADIEELQTQLDTALDTKIIQTYAFNYYGRDFVWELSISLRTYLHYKELPRIDDTSKYTTMVTDSYANDLINVIVDEIEEAILRFNYNKADVVNLVGTFVQSLVHANDETDTPYDDYPRYPIETLFDEGVDCEDTSILAAAILERLDYDQVFFVFSQPKHVALGVYALSVINLDGWEYEAKRYIYLETTGELWTLGHMPSTYNGLQPAIYPIGE